MNKILFLICIFFINSCSNFNEKDKKLPHPGKRITIIEHDTKYVADNDLKNTKVKIPAQYLNKNWPISDGNQNGLLPQNFKITNDLKFIEKISLGNASPSLSQRVSPIIIDNKLFSLRGSNIVAFDLEKKKIVWSTKLTHESGSYGGGLLFVDKTIYVTNGSKIVTAINIEDGAIKWQYEFSNISRAAPYYNDNKLFVLTIDNKLYAINVTDGSFIWQHQGHFENVASIKNPSPVSKANLVIAPYNNGDAVIIDVNSGNELAQINLANQNITGHEFSIKDIDVTPIIDQDNLFAINNEGILVSISLNSGEINWKREYHGFNHIWLAENFLYAMNSNGEVIALSKDNGKVKWHKTISLKANDKLIGMIMAGDNLFIIESSGNINLLSPNDGANNGVVKTNIILFYQPIIVNGKLYLFDNKGNINIWG